MSIALKSHIGLGDTGLTNFFSAGLLRAFNVSVSIENLLREIHSISQTNLTTEAIPSSF